MIDPLYFLFLAPGMLLALWAQWRVKSAFSEGAQVPSSMGITGAETAQAILDAEGIRDVAIEPVQGYLSDHYDPTHKVLRLSEDVYSGHSLAAMGVAAHEVGHAIQDARRYAPLVARNAIVPLAGLGSNLSWIVMVAGLMVGMFQVVLLGILLFSLTVLFQVVNLPVEFDASRRARERLLAIGLIRPAEDATVGHVLNAAALTYIAGTITSVLTLLYFLTRLGGLGSGRDE